MNFKLDGGLKPHRPLCGAKYSGVRHFPQTGIKVITGCTNIPSSNSKYCKEHENSQQPCVLASKLEAETRKTLKVTKFNVQEESYTVQALLETKIDPKTKQRMFLVKWKDFTDEQATWEPEKHIPPFIVKYYTDNTDLFGQPIPAPRIEETKTVSGSTYYRGAMFIFSSFDKIILTFDLTMYYYE